MKHLSIDIETYSSINLAKSGVYRYAESPDFEILLFAYAIDGGEPKLVDLAMNETLPIEIHEALLDEGVIKWAFNAQFERVCLSRHLGIKLAPESWRCTMVWAATLGLPLSLEGVGIVAGLEKQKLKEGKDLIRYFSLPCKPTAINGGRNRNLPSDDPEKWEHFKKYCIRDVEVEMALQEKFRKFPVSEMEWNNYHLDQRINDRGIGLDMNLVEQAIRCDEEFRTTHIDQARKLTGLENPNSTQQLKGWLSEQGIEVESLSKAAVNELLEDADGEVEAALELRLSLAKSSVKKYAAMKECVGQGGRARGLMQFYGANRTGRFAGRLIQVQNLPQNHLPDLELARGLIREGAFETANLLYDSIPVLLSELIRTAFVPKPGCRFYVADFSAIEARVIAWLAGEKWRMDVFASHGKIYEASAAQMFQVPIGEITKGSPLRQKGKQAELACIAEGEQVLTDRGLVPIEEVTLKHQLWDGEAWVAHDGVIYRGIKEVITYEGLRATPDHLVWTEGEQRPVSMGYASACRTHLVQTGDGRREIWLGDCRKPRKKMEQSKESLLRTHEMQRMQLHPMAKFKQSQKGEIKGLPGLLPEKKDSILAGQKADGSKAAMRKPQRTRLQKLWCSGDSMEVSISTTGWYLDDGEFSGPVSQSGNRSNRQQQGLRTRKYPTCSSYNQPEQQTDYSADSLGSKILAVCPQCRDQKTIRGIEPRGNNYRGKKGSTGEKEKLETHRSTSRVYDIRNAGPHHRFTVSGKLVHNCGYGGSVGALKAMGALQMGVPEEELMPLVTAWRQANPHIVQLWWAVDKAATKAVREKTTTTTHGLQFSYQSGMLFITLPSGRNLCYVKPRMGMNQFGNEGVTYEGVGTSKKWMRIESYGPKFVENIVQAIARDLLVEAMQRLEAKGYSIVMHVHDEVVIEGPEGTELEDICSIMGETPAWAKGLLMKADGYVCDFYKKE